MKRRSDRSLGTNSAARVPLIARERKLVETGHDVVAGSQLGAIFRSTAASWPPVSPDGSRDGDKKERENGTRETAETHGERKNEKREGSTDRPGCWQENDGENKEPVNSKRSKCLCSVRLGSN